MHGKTSLIVCRPHAMYNEIPTEHNVCRYHSLRLTHLPNELLVTAETKEGIPMAFAHKSYPHWGVQYHPEAILTEFGKDFIRNWLNSIKEMGA